MRNANFRKWMPTPVAVPVIDALGALAPALRCAVIVPSLTFLGCLSRPVEPKAMLYDSSVEQIVDFFARQGKTVLTFTGYSGAGYEDPAGMLDQARSILAEHDPESTVVNIGATAAGIGAVYEVAGSMGFPTTGIVSSQAKTYSAELSPFVGTVFYVEDDTWGGYLAGSARLSPTSEAMVRASDILVGIGGGDVSRDELIEARRRGKAVTFIPADMSHEAAIEKARRKGLPMPTDFRGAAHAAFAGGK